VLNFDTANTNNCGSEVFGTSEDESVEMDHSEDSENGAHITLFPVVSSPS